MGQVAEPYIPRKAIRIRNQGAQKALDFVLHLALTTGAICARSAGVTLVVLHLFSGQRA